MPSIQTPGQEVLPFAQITAAERGEKEREKKQEAQKNWLVNGVNRLAESSSTGNPAKARKESVEPVSAPLESGAGESTDSQYLLKLYDEQGKGREERNLAERPRASTTANPLEPFLQGWLGNSPVRGQFFDEFSGKPASSRGLGSGPTSAPGVRETPLPAYSSSAAPSPAPAEQPQNPYLVTASPTGQPNLDQYTRNEAPPVLPGSGLTIAPPPQPALPAMAPVPVQPALERKPPPAPWTEEKKYFPQLKKF